MPRSGRQYFDETGGSDAEPVDDEINKNEASPNGERAPAPPSKRSKQAKKGETFFSSKMDSKDDVREVAQRSSRPLGEENSQSIAKGIDVELQHANFDIKDITGVFSRLDQDAKDKLKEETILSEAPLVSNNGESVVDVWLNNRIERHQHNKHADTQRAVGEEQNIAANIQEDADKLRRQFAKAVDGLAVADGRLVFDESVDDESSATENPGSDRTSVPRFQSLEDKPRAAQTESESLEGEVSRDSSGLDDNLPENGREKPSPNTDRDFETHESPAGELSFDSLSRQFKQKLAELASEEGSEAKKSVIDKLISAVNSYEAEAVLYELTRPDFENEEVLPEAVKGYLKDQLPGKFVENAKNNSPWAKRSHVLNNVVKNIFEADDNEPFGEDNTNENQGEYNGKKLEDEYPQQFVPLFMVPAINKLREEAPAIANSFLDKLKRGEISEETLAEKGITEALRNNT